MEYKVQMKKLLLATLLTGFVETSQASFIAPAGTNPNTIAYPTERVNSTVADKTLWKDDQIVFLKGAITKQVKKDKFMFSDGTGEVLLEIDDDDWDGVDLTLNEEFIVKAKVDQERKKGLTKIEAIELFKNTTK